jgi:ATP-dependent protease ClpP protease subunit
MYHEVSYEPSYQKIQVHEADIKEGKETMKMYDEIITSHTNLSLSFLNKIKKNNRDYYFSSQDALKYKIIDNII